MRPADLTRWNRAGLGRFRYVDGSAITYLERLREAAAEELPQWQALQRDLPAAPADETTAARHARLQRQYDAPRRDYAWEILRSLSRSAHVLNEHLDAYVNESFIGTATQWEHLRRLVAMLDYHPAPPASARAPLALMAAATGRLDAGFQVKHTPPDGGPPVVFETLQGLDLEPALNELRFPQWDRSQQPFTYATAGTDFAATFPLPADVTPPRVGDVAILAVAAATGGAAGEWLPVRIDTLAPADATGVRALMLRGPARAGGSLAVKRWQVSLATDAAAVQAPRLFGPGVVRVNPEHTLVAGASRVVWGAGSTWTAALVGAVDGERVLLTNAAGTALASGLPVTGQHLYLLARAGQQNTPQGPRLVLPLQRGATGKVWNEALAQIGTVSTHREANTDIYAFVSGNQAFFLGDGAPPAATVQAPLPAGLTLDGDPGDLTAGARIVNVVGTNLQLLTVQSVQVFDTSFRLTTDITPTPGGLLHFNFAQPTRRPVDFDRNLTDPVFDEAARSAQSTTLVLDVAVGSTCAALLINGREVLVVGDSGAHAATVVGFDPDVPNVRIAPPLPGTLPGDPPGSVAFTRHGTVVLANVVSAGHGESKPSKVLGSGDTTRSGQRFTLGVDEVTFIADASMPAGVAAALAVTVEDQRWTQVANLRDSRPADPHFEAHLDETGALHLQFGDGVNGRRLPTGTNNVAAVYRKGVGEAGNLAAGSLVTPVNPDPLVAAVRQPLAAGGGNELESTASLRGNAPASVLTLERAVSLDDFAHLAERHASVWQAHAYGDITAPGRQDHVQVVIVPAGGPGVAVSDDVARFLASHTLPGVRITVSNFQPVYLQLDVTLRVDLALFDPVRVAIEVKRALADVFSIRRMRLGAPLFVSQITFAVEQVVGVANSDVVVRPATWEDAAAPPAVTHSAGGALRSIRTRPGQLVYLDPEAFAPNVITQPFIP